VTFRRRAVLILAAAALVLGTVDAEAQSRRRPPPAPPPAAAAPAQPDWISHPVAVFVGLDKITGRATDFEAKIGQTVRYGALAVTPRVCDTKPETDRPQTVAFVQIEEFTLQKTTQRIFSGWMFAASPGLNGPEAPIYDVWLKSCSGGQRPVAAEEPH
jgi:hypothetical protein